MRLMVYNAEARDWIWDANRGFRLLGFDYQSDADVAAARKLLTRLAEKSPRLSERLNHMGRSSLENNSRFADTFLHPWEARTKVQEWIETFEKEGLKPVALFDRYAELDDLENPLWTMPTKDQLRVRCEDLRFENNLEIWLRKADAVQVSGIASEPTPMPTRFRLLMPPTTWTRFPECRTLTFVQRWTIWHGLLKSLYGQKDKASQKLIKELTSPTAQRLARIGAITRNQARDAGLEAILLKGIHPHMDVPTLAPQASLEREIREMIEPMPFKQSPQKVNAAVCRLQRIT